MQAVSSKRKIALGILKVLMGVGIVWGIYLLRGYVWMRLYPVGVVGFVLLGFGRSLRPGAMPMVEYVARKVEGAAFDEAMVGYCRRVTWTWVIFLALHLAVTIGTLWAPLKVWALYNGAIAYGLLGGMFVGEWVLRKGLYGRSR